VLPRVGSIGLHQKWQIDDPWNRLAIERDPPERRLEGVDRRNRNPAERDVMRRPDHDDAADNVPLILQAGKCRGRHLARIDVTCVGGDQRCGAIALVP
jgi:hypothetical protein